MAEIIYPLKCDASCNNIKTTRTYTVSYSHIKWKTSPAGAPCFQATKLSLLGSSLVVEGNGEHMEKLSQAQFTITCIGSEACDWRI